MPPLAKWADKPFPRLHQTGAMPLGLGHHLQQIAGREAHLRYTPGHWLHSVAKSPPFECDVKDVATFVWSLAAIRLWLKSPERDEQYSIASDRVHRLPPKLEPKRAIFAQTVELYSERGAQRLEAFLALGFAFACGEGRHSLKLWRPFSLPICQTGLGKRSSVLADDDAMAIVIKEHFQNLRSRLNTAIDDLGRNEVHKRSQILFAALRAIAFPTFRRKV